MRIDPPGDGLYIVIDFTFGRMFTIRDADRSVIDMAAPKNWVSGQATRAGSRYVRRNTITLSSVFCTEWQTTDSEGRDVRICPDEDGVMSRTSTHIAAGEPFLAQTASFLHQLQDRAIFRVPPEYHHLAAPPIPGAQ